MFDSEQPHQKFFFFENFDISFFLGIKFEINQFTFQLFLQNAEFFKLFENFVV